MKSIDRFEGDIAIIDDDGKLYGMRRDMRHPMPRRATL